MKQRDDEWRSIRVGRITGSRADALMAVTRAGKPTARREELIAQLVAERNAGQPFETATTFAMRRGSELEDEALGAYQMATGVLVLCTGKATKRVSEFIDSDKEYEGTIEFGVATDTDDAEGRQIDTKPVPDFSVVDIDKALEKFRGNIEQIPPMYSALKRNGKRLYKMARKGIVIEREPRPVTIFKLECLDWKRPFLKIRVCCSKGTYIRALARDIGTLLQTGGCLTELCRTRVGVYRIEDSCSLDTFKSFFETAYADI